MSSSVRIVMAEVEGSDELVQSVITSFADRLVKKVTTENGEHTFISLPAAPEAAQLPAPVVAAEVEAPPSPAPKKPRKVKEKPAFQFRKTAERMPVAKEAVPEINGEVQQKLAGILARGPQTSGELIRLSGLTSASVYSCLHVMRLKGTVQTREDPADAQKKNYLVH